MPDITARPDSNRLHVTTNLLNPLHLAEWAVKIQIFGITLSLNEFTFHNLINFFCIPVHTHSYVAWGCYGQNS